jgi:ABC-2 type transport system ATP-binding protein
VQVCRRRDGEAVDVSLMNPPSVQGAPTIARMAGTVVAADQVAKRWGSTTALTSATFTIGAGITGLLGANGAGKTTLLTLILGLHRPDGGRLSVLGVDPVEAGPTVRARIGYAPEHDALPPDVAAHDIVRHIAEVHGLPSRVATARASDALYEVGLGEERFRPVGTMSTGQRQRVKLAQAIVHDPALVLLDEPTNGLDPVQRDQMLSLIRHVGHDLGLDVVLSSHLLDEVERVSDAVVIIEHGHATVGGRLDDLRNAGANELVLSLDDQVGAAALVPTLKARGLGAVHDGRATLVVALGADADFDAVRDEVAAAGLGIRSMRVRTRSLEEVFLSGQLGAEAPQPAP